MRTINKIDSNGSYLGTVAIIDEIVYDNNQNITLDELKQNKINELDQACKNTILSDFIATLNGIDYHFAYDSAAQSRFNGVGILFLGGQITQVDWTAYQNGTRIRITLTKDDFNVISLAALKHQNDNITKYNQLLQDVDNALSSDDLSKIKW